MSNVKPLRPDRQKHEGKSRAARKVALLCCSLFLFLQSLIFFSRFSPSLPSSYRLSVKSSNELTLVSARGPENLPTTGQPLVVEQLRFSPFFFEPIAINFCDKELLMSVKGIGPSLADSILHTRDRLGGFQKAEDLLQVKGIGETRRRRFAEHFDFSSNDRLN